MKNRTLQFKPSKIMYIPKSKGQIRTIGFPTPRDKVIQQAIKLIIESRYEHEHIFLNTSHGFRPKRNTSTAIDEIRK
jgi:retron-type reverse transcriptase